MTAIDDMLFGAQVLAARQGVVLSCRGSSRVERPRLPDAQASILQTMLLAVVRLTAFGTDASAVYENMPGRLRLRLSLLPSPQGFDAAVQAVDQAGAQAARLGGFYKRVVHDDGYQDLYMEIPNGMADEARDAAAPVPERASRAAMVATAAAGGLLLAMRAAGVSLVP